jgi:23S rRNA (pseudouridine1915-N3)-methyltransferase
MKAGPERELAQRYIERFEAAGRGLGLTFAGISEIRESRAADAGERRAEESLQLRRWLEEGRVVVLLDERGRELDSVGLARRIGNWRDEGVPECVFAIGGPDGHDPALLAAVPLAVSFGRMTWPHQLCRIMLAEQLYRCVTILAGHPYHR